MWHFHRPTIWRQVSQNYVSVSNNNEAFSWNNGLNGFDYRYLMNRTHTHVHSYFKFYDLPHPLSISYYVCHYKCVSSFSTLFWQPPSLFWSLYISVQWENKLGNTWHKTKIWNGLWIVNKFAKLCLYIFLGIQAFLGHIQLNHTILSREN